MDRDDEHRHLLEVHGLDLLAQTEAMLRSVREYQTALRQLQEPAGPREGDRRRIEAVWASVARMRETCGRIGDTLNDVRTIVDSLAS